MNHTSLIQIEIISPSQIPADDRVEFERLVTLGSEVNPATLPGLVDRALVLAIAKLNGTIVGVGGIKRPYDTHRQFVFEQAQFAQEAENYIYELGWVYVCESARGQRLSSRLVEALMKSVSTGNAYATSAIDNERMHSALSGVGFTPSGSSYPSTQNNTPIQLFVCK